MLGELPESINQLVPLHRILLHSLSLTTYYGNGEDDKGKFSLQQLFVSGHIRPATLLRLARKLIEISHPVEAGRVLQFLLKQNPGNHAALAELIRIDLMTQKTGQAVEKSQTMVENKTMPFELMKELISYLSADHQLYHTRETELVSNILESVTPSKRKRLLEEL